MAKEVPTLTGGRRKNKKMSQIKLENFIYRPFSKNLPVFHNPGTIEDHYHEVKLWKCSLNEI